MTVHSKSHIARKIMPALIILLVLVYVLLRIFVPPFIDKKYNPLINPTPYHASDEALRLYRGLNFISDLHSDVLLWDRDISQRHDYGHEDIPRMLDVNLALQVFSIVNKVPRGLNFAKNSGDSDLIVWLSIVQGRPVSSWFDLTQRVLVQARSLQRYAQESQGQLHLITSKQTLEKYLQARQRNPKITAGLLSVEGAQALQGDINNLETIYQAGVRMIGLTHFFDNEVGGSAHGIKKGGLTDFGKQLIKEMERRHILVDVAHASPRLVDHVLAIARRPIIVSHTGVKGTCNNIRNLSDRHLKRIALSGGVVGIAAFKHAICGTTAKAMARAIKYTVDLIGARHVALGTDFDGAVASIFDVTGLPLLVDELLKLGLTEHEIHLIMGENIKRLLLENLPSE